MINDKIAKWVKEHQWITCIGLMACLYAIIYLFLHFLRGSTRVNLLEYYIVVAFVFVLPYIIVKKTSKYAERFEQEHLITETNEQGIKKKIMVGYAYKFVKEPHIFRRTNECGEAFFRKPLVLDWHDPEQDDWREVVCDYESSEGYSLQTLKELADWIIDVNWFGPTLPKGYKILHEHEEIEYLPSNAIVFGVEEGNAMAFIWEEEL